MGGSAKMSAGVRPQPIPQPPAIAQALGGEVVFKEGMIKIQIANLVKNWEPRYFRLTPSRLTFFKDSKDVKLNISIALSEAAVSISDRKPFAFFVASPDKVINIWPQSKQERDEWMNAIKNVVKSPFEGVSATASMAIKSDDSSSGSSGDEGKVNVGMRAGGGLIISGGFASVRGEVVKEGFLQKQGQKRKNWKRRWFALFHEGIFYFDTPEKRQEKGSIPFTGGVVQVGTGVGKGHGFWVQMGQRRLNMQANSLDEQELWTKAIEDVLSRY